MRNAYDHLSSAARRTRDGKYTWAELDAELRRRGSSLAERAAAPAWEGVVMSNRRRCWFCRRPAPTHPFFAQLWGAFSNECWDCHATYTAARAAVHELARWKLPDDLDAKRMLPQKLVVTETEWTRVIEVLTSSTNYREVCHELGVTSRDVDQQREPDERYDLASLIRATAAREFFCAQLRLDQRDRKKGKDHRTDLDLFDLIEQVDADEARS